MRSTGQVGLKSVSFGVWFTLVNTISQSSARSALELIAMTATTAAAGRADRVSAAATDMGAHGGGVSALQKIERAAIAAATPVSYSPQVLVFFLRLLCSGSLFRIAYAYI